MTTSIPSGLSRLQAFSATKPLQFAATDDKNKPTDGKKADDPKSTDKSWFDTTDSPEGDIRFPVFLAALGGMAAVGMGAIAYTLFSKPPKK